MSTIATLWFDKVAPLQLYRTIKLPRAGLSIDKAAVFHHNLWALALGKLSPIFFLFFASGLENLLERPKPGKPSMKSLTPAYVWLMFFFGRSCFRTPVGGPFLGGGRCKLCETVQHSTCSQACLHTCFVAFLHGFPASYNKPACSPSCMPT